MEGIIALLMIFGIPIVAILSSTYIKALKLKVEKGGGMLEKDRKLLERLLSENSELRKRVENLETITTDSDMARLNSHTAEPRIQKQIDLLAEEIARLKSKN